MEHQAENSILTIPNDLVYLPAIQAFISEIADKVGFGRRDTTMMLIAIEEAVVNVVKHAFEPDEKATFQVIVKPGNSGITIVIKDKGLPYSPSLVPEYSAHSDIDGAAKAGLGSYLVKKGVDEIFFHNLGREGKELHLVKYLPYRSVQDINAASELERFPEPVQIEPIEKNPFRSVLLSLPKSTMCRNFSIGHRDMRTASIPYITRKNWRKATPKAP
jgi:anti-sigma regulatory factor (Ser/Thr protein kinase)